MILLWGVTITLILFLIYFGLNSAGFSSQIQALIAVAIFVLLSILAFKLYRGVKANLNKAKTGNEALIGAVGVATTNLRPKGEVRVEGEFWQAEAMEGWLDKGAEVQVTDIRNITLYVKTKKVDSS